MHTYKIKKQLLELMASDPAKDDKYDSDTEKQIVRTAIIAELDAINLYEQMANKSRNKKVKKVLLDVAREEKVHIGEFEALIEILDKEHEAAEDEGKEEVEQED